MTNSRRPLYLALLILVTSTVSGKAKPPNILLILADDVGCETLGCYGGRSYRTPHLDKLAATGLRFRHCYSMPVCHPTRTCLLTGRYPRHLGHPRWGSFPAADERHALGHGMKAAKYATAVAGKWQIAMLGKDLDHPHRLGFDEYCLFGWHEGPRYYQPLLWQNGKQRPDVKDRFGPDVYCEFLIDFIKRHRDGPFLAFYSMALCHDVTDDLDQPVPYARGKDHYDTYKEMLEAMDVRVGRMIQALQSLGLRKNTLVLFTTDNGTSKRSLHQAIDGKYIRRPVSSLLGKTPIPGGKGNLSDDGTHVPLIANWPGRIRPGGLSDHLVDMSDFLPTLLELAGRQPQTDRAVKIDGQSFAGILTGRGGRKRTWAYAERGKQFFVRTQQWKLYNNGKLFHASRDPGERKPVALADVPRAARGEIERLRQALKTIDRGHPFPRRASR